MESKIAVKSLGALAQETRLTILRMLVQQGPAGLSAGSIGNSLRLAPATLSFHLRELSQAGLVCSRQQSRFIYYSADVSAMNALLGYLAENCCRASSACTPADDAPCASSSMPSEPGRIAASAPKPVIHPKRSVA